MYNEASMAARMNPGREPALSGFGHLREWAESYCEHFPSSLLPDEIRMTASEEGRLRALLGYPGANFFDVLYHNFTQINGLLESESRRQTASDTLLESGIGSPAFLFFVVGSGYLAARRLSDRIDTRRVLLEGREAARDEIGRWDRYVKRGIKFVASERQSPPERLAWPSMKDSFRSAIYPKVLELGNALDDLRASLAEESGKLLEFIPPQRIFTDKVPTDTYRAFREIVASQGDEFRRRQVARDIFGEWGIVISLESYGRWHSRNQS